VIALAVQLGVAVRPMRREVRHALVRGLGMSEEPRVLLNPVIRSRAVTQRGLKASLAGVRRVGEAANGSDVLRQRIPDFLEPPAVVHLRLAERIAQHDERVDFDGGVNLHPVLYRADAVVGLAPRVVATAVARRIGRYDDLALRQQRHDVRVEPPPDREPSLLLVLPA